MMATAAVGASIVVTALMMGTASVLSATKRTNPGTVKTVESNTTFPSLPSPRFVSAHHCFSPESRPMGPRLTPHVEASRQFPTGCAWLGP